MTANNNPDLSRRAVLGGLFALGVVVVGYTVMPHVVFAQPAPANAFLALSEFLTGKKLDARLAARYRAALAKHDPKFEAAAAALQRFVDDAKAANVDALIALPALDPALRRTITAIVSAWYLGIVGDGADVVLISYAEAVMYRPTAGALVIPTYGGGPGSWGPKPVVATEGLQ
jgi:hypothetical protein